MSWEEKVLKVTPYIPGEQPQVADIIKLNTNENPYPPSPAVIKAMADFDAGKLRRYPDANATELVKAISSFYDIPEECIFTGVGSDDVLAVAFLTFFSESGLDLLFPDISYSFYKVWAELYRIPARLIPVDKDFRINVREYFGAPGGVVIANPNAPTGLVLPLSDIETVVANNPDVVVIIDEAYIDFGGESALSLIKDHDNLLVLRTCSKSMALAGSRIGYAFGSKKLIDCIKDVKFSINSYTMNMQTIVAGAAAFSDRAYFEMNCARIIATRKRLADELTGLGFTFPESSSNFIFATNPDCSAKYIFEELKKRNIYVRHWDAPRISEYLRISVGTEEEVDSLINALKEILPS